MVRGNTLVVVAILFMFARLQVLAAEKPSIASCEGASTERVVRFDEDAKRVFVQAQLKQIGTPNRARSALKRLQALVDKCRPSWGKAWSVSFFSEPKYAGYKDEPQLRSYVMDGRWSRAYVGEYDQAAKKLTLNPADPKRVRSFAVELP